MIFKQEGPAKICVNDATMRTTSTLEAYNKVLADNVVHRGHFFKFVHGIRSEELLKAREVEQLFESGGKTAKKRKLEWMVCVFTSINECFHLINLQ